MLEFFFFWVDKPELTEYVRTNLLIQHQKNVKLKQFIQFHKN